jgi:hypothetical protein
MQSHMGGEEGRGRRGNAVHLAKVTEQDQSAFSSVQHLEISERKREAAVEALGNALVVILRLSGMPA